MDGYAQIPVPQPGPQQPRPSDGGTPSQGCAWCGSTRLEPGFIEDTGQGSRGFARWIVGGLEKGIFGGASRFGRERLDISGMRCADCGHLEFFAQ